VGKSFNASSTLKPLQYHLALFSWLLLSFHVHRLVFCHAKALCALRRVWKIRCSWAAAASKHSYPKQDRGSQLLLSVTCLLSNLSLLPLLASSGIYRALEAGSRHWVCDVEEQRQVVWTKQEAWQMLLMALELL
jgi:hypothetical protein